MEIYRKCPVCGKNIVYKSVGGYQHACKKNSPCRSCSNAISNRKNGVKILLDGSLKSFYYIGFLMADGHIEKNVRLQITLSKKDINWLENFCKYVKGKKIRTFNVGPYEMCSFNVQDKESIPEICNVFDLKGNKTKNPPSISVFNNMGDKEILSLIIGFIDGDGSIENVHKRNDFSIRIKNDSSWLSILEMFSTKISGKNFAKINGSGHAEVSFTKFSDIKKLKKFSTENNLPILERKWDKIDVNKQNKTEIAQKNKETIKSLSLKNLTINEMVEETGLKYMTIYGILNRNNIKFNKDERKSNRKRSE